MRKIEGTLHLSSAIVWLQLSSEPHSLGLSFLTSALGSKGGAGDQGLLGLGQLCDEASPYWRWWAGASLSFQTDLCFSYSALQTATLPFLCVQVMLSPCLALTLLCSNLLSTLQELLSPPRLSRALVSASPCLISNYNSCACSKSRLLPQHLPASLFLSSCPSCM